jgi:methionine--tRNA ligase beta chain
VGRIVDIKKHDQADSLYVEQIDVGEDKPRTIVSGLVNYIPIEKMQNRLVLVCTNLQPAALRGVTSEGMVLAATKRDKKEVQGLDLVNPPEGAKVGETVSFEGDSAEPDRPSISNARLKKLLKVCIIPPPSSLCAFPPFAGLRALTPQLISFASWCAGSAH